MKPRNVQVVAPSRLHFGLLSFGKIGRRFGGAGVMLDHPQVELTAERANEFRVEGPRAGRVRAFAQSWHSHSGIRAPLNCLIRVHQVPPQHAGLGSGTQLGLSVAAALNTLHDQPSPTPLELAQSVGRGQRSAVGTYGFLQGGLIAERGKDRERLSPLDCRAELPESWRFVLIQPKCSQGLSGSHEKQAFEHLPPVATHVMQDLEKELRQHLIPAAFAGDFQRFSESVYRYGNKAGGLFSPIQGGPYNGPLLNALVKQIRDAGVQGVGQSSWGPTLFALVENQQHAEELIAHLREQLVGQDVPMDISGPNNSGATIRAIA